MDRLMLSFTSNGRDFARTLPFDELIGGLAHCDESVVNGSGVERYLLLKADIGAGSLRNVRFSIQRAKSGQAALFPFRTEMVLFTS